MWRRKIRPSEPVRLLVRHADAGVRSEWRGSDEWRGLTDVGHGQARAIVRMIGDLPVERILSSPSLRCRQTVVPLVDLATESAVVCTHRETLQALFEHLAGRYGMVTEAVEPMEKAAVWVLRGTVGEEQAARLEYLGSAAALAV